MKKSKFLKTLAALTLGAVAAAGCISIAACSDGGHTHTTTLGWQKNSTEHWHVCDEDDAEYDKAPHAYTLENNTKCVCGATKSTTPGGEVTAHTNTYSYTSLTTAMGITDDGEQTATDQVAVTQAHLTTPNDFLTVTGNGDVKWRCLKKATGGAIEVKDGGLSVTYTGTGTLTINFGSTSSSNTSGIALLKSDGTYVDATSTTGTKLTEDQTVVEGYVNKAGLVTKEGGQKAAEAATVTYTITEAGTYTIYCSYSYEDTTKDTGAASRGSRIWSISMVDNY